MRYGTFLCWIFGHKFSGKKIVIKEDRGPFGTKETITTNDACLRCGIKNGGNNE